MKKMNNKGFILAETLIVSVFLMVMFTMIYSNFYPLIGEYEKREVYDDVDGKYTAYWIKKMIESDGYILSSDKIKTMNKFGYIRFECSDISSNNNQRDMCINLVNSLEIANCDGSGNDCDAYITRYTIGAVEDKPDMVSFKDQIRNRSIKRWNEVCIGNIDPFDVPDALASDSACAVKAFRNCCLKKGLSTCTSPDLTSHDPEYGEMYTGDQSAESNSIVKLCNSKLTKKAISSATKDYILTLPDYRYTHNSTGAKYRVIVVVRHRKDNNDYYSFSTMEVIK